MSGLVLKVLAAALMAVDHVGAVFFPQQLWLCALGRLSFPLFCFLLAEGLAHTSNVRRYLVRLFLFAIVSEVPFDLAFYGVPFYWQYQNVLFTLALGLLAAWALQQVRRAPVPAVACALGAALLAVLCRADYGWFGVLLVAAFSLLRERPVAKSLAFLALNACFSYTMAPVQLAAGAALPLLLCYNGGRGRYSLKYFFYLFYPVHLLLIWALHSFL